MAIVGSGPAGATASRLLAELGAHVVLLEARRLPRPKLCGGGLTPKALALIPAEVSAIIERRIDRMEIAGARVPNVHLHLPAASVAMVERDRFDMALVEAAARSGAEVRDSWPVENALQLDNATQEGTGVRLEGPRGSLRADVLVVADGEPSRLARRLGIGGEAPRRSLALEVDLPFAPGRSTDELQLSFREPGGYAWYFPKGDHANVGILSWRAEHQASLRDRLTRYANGLGLDLAGRRVRGHWIPQGLRGGPLASGRVLLVGDAAGIGDPFFGEGISYAMASAGIAATVIDEWANGHLAGLEPYEARLRSSLSPAMRRLSLVSGIADRAPSASLLALRWIPWARGEAVRAIAGLGSVFALPAG